MQEGKQYKYLRDIFVGLPIKINMQPSLGIVPVRFSGKDAIEQLAGHKTFEIRLFFSLLMSIQPDIPNLGEIERIAKVFIN